MVICEPGSIEPALKVRANIYILTKGGTGKPLKHMGQEMIFSRTFDCMAATLYDNPPENYAWRERRDEPCFPYSNGKFKVRTSKFHKFFRLSLITFQEGRQIHSS